MDHQPDNGISMKDFLTRNKLPQVVRVVSGMYDMAEEISLARDQILTLHSLKNYETVKATDEDGHHFYLPLNVTTRVSIVSKTSWRQTYEDVETLSDEFPSLVVSKEEHECFGIEQGDILKPIHTRYTGPREGYLQCALVNKPQRDDILIPLSFSAMFETLESSDQNSLFLTEVVTNYMLPVQVKFLEHRLTIQKYDINFCRPTYFDELGVLTLLCQSDINLVIATTSGPQDRSRPHHRSLITIPDDLDIKVVPVANTPRKRTTKKPLLELDFCDVNFVYGSTIITETPILPTKTRRAMEEEEDIPPPLPPRICVDADGCQCDSCRDNITTSMTVTVEDDGSDATLSTNITDDCHGNGSHDNIVITTEGSGSDVIASIDSSDYVSHGNGSEDNTKSSMSSVIVNGEGSDSSVMAASSECSDGGCQDNSCHDNTSTGVTITTENTESNVLASLGDKASDNSCHDNISNSVTVTTESTGCDVTASIDCNDDCNGSQGNSEGSLPRNKSVEGEDIRDGENVFDKLLSGRTLEAKEGQHINMGADLEVDDDQYPEAGNGNSVAQQKLDELKRIKKERAAFDKETCLKKLALDSEGPREDMITHKVPSLDTSQPLLKSQSPGFSNNVRTPEKPSRKGNVDSFQDQNASSTIDSMRSKSANNSFAKSTNEYEEILELVNTNECENASSNIDSVRSKSVNNSFPKCANEYEEICELVNMTDCEKTSVDNPNADKDPEEDNHEELACEPLVFSSSVDLARDRCNTLPSLHGNRKPKNTRSERFKKLTNFARSLKRSQSTTDMSGYGYDSVSSKTHREKGIATCWSLRRGSGKRTEQSRTRWYV